MAATIVLLLFQTVFLASTSALQCETKNSEYGYKLLDSALATFKADGVGTCFEKCLVNQRCSSINYDLLTFQCDHNHLTKVGFPSKLVRKESSIYAEIRHPDYGASAHTPSPSCKFIKKRKPQAASGIYWIQVSEPVSLTFQVYCEMQTDGGGWTLVYNYYFTNVTFFSSLGNAITPIPSWPVNQVPSKLAPVSKQVPLDEWTYAAMDFPMWKRIGNEFLVKSMITNWIACTNGTGDLVNWKEGTLNCRPIKYVANVCLGYVPTRFEVVSYCGPALRGDSGLSFFFFDGAITSCYPTHDPCGTSQITNHRTDVQAPEGSIYIR